MCESTRGLFEIVTVAGKGCRFGSCDPVVSLHPLFISA